mgnify:CR=1 FL=1
MEDFVKGSFLSVISFFVIVCLLIIGLPWLWNWIVFIFQSPLSAGQASKAYLIDSFMECLPFILTTILILLSLDIVINRRYNSVDDEVELFAGSKIYIPTPQVGATQKTPPEIKEEAKTDNSIQSRGETVIVVVPSKNGGQFLHVVPGTKEHQDALAQKAAAEKELDLELKEQANEKLKEFKAVLMKQ